MGRVLILDDDESFLRIACLIIESTGHECVRASTATEAIALAASVNPDYYILDIRLGEHLFDADLPDGVSLFEDLKKMYPRCKVIFTSAHTDYDEGYLLRRGAAFFIDKENFPTYIERAMNEIPSARALLIDDDISFSFIASQLLSAKGVQCIPIAGKTEISQHFEECDLTTFDAIISDVLLDPQANFHGWDVLGLIPRAFPIDSVFLLTGQSSDAIEKQIGKSFSELTTRRQLLTAISLLSEHQILDKEQDSWATKIADVCKKAALSKAGQL